MRLTSLAILFTLVAGIAGAQTVTLDIDKSTIPGLGIDLVVPYELDGNPATREFMQWRTDPMTGQTLIRPIATAPRICLSPWFNPFDYVTLRPSDFFIAGQVMRAGDRDKFIYSGLQSYGELDLYPTSCTN